MFDVFRPRKLESDDMGGIGEVLRKAMQAYGGMQTLKKQTTENRYLPQEKEEGLKSLIAKAMMDRQNAAANPEMLKYKLEQEKLGAPNLRSQIASRDTETSRTQQMTPLDLIKKQLENKYLPAEKEAGIESTKAMSELRKRGGFGQGVRGREELLFNSGVAQDNPHLTTNEQIREAANAYSEGKDTLSDGTPLKPMSPSTKRSLDALTKATTYAGAAVPIIKAKQADAELKTLMDMSQKDFEYYATTYNGYSPKQIIDTFKNDDASQVKLGNFIASQAAQYEAAQIRNRIAGGEPGISATQELMGKSAQIIDSKFPRLSAKARAQAAKRLDQYLDAGLKARISVGIGASDITKKPPENKGKQRTYNIETGSFE
jgi:hypothetical protein